MAAVMSRPEAHARPAPEQAARQKKSQAWSLLGSTAQAQAKKYKKKCRLPLIHIALIAIFLIAKL
ncbi:hypothetical protein [Acidovorax sp. 62]|uniref:hypothetical protein n=1 Tax=Acidovorax sp. 62 TaxID=2035203 RepID=UPI0011781556|nr:hypothetical protein [Acidovorax sp. 62]